MFVGGDDATAVDIEVNPQAVSSLSQEPQYSSSSPDSAKSAYTDP
jgi:hypothetical protein